MENEKKRLLSLDLLRGFDMFMLLMVAPIAVQWLTIWNNPTGNVVLNQFGHTPWQGFTCWDMVMPLFMFMSGITIPFSMSKYKDGRMSYGHFYHKLIKRFFVLFLLGWIVQGNLLALDPHYFYVYANTLQSIAVGYVVAAIVYVHFPIKVQIGWCIAFFVIFLIVFATAGHWSWVQGNNIAETIDEHVLGRFRNGVIWQGNTWHFDSNYHYTWVLSSLNFAVTVMMGSFAGYILKSMHNARYKLGMLFFIGILLVIAGLAMDPVCPIIKHIWSSSMTLLSGGICFLLMALFFWLFDMKCWTCGFGWLKYYGMNALVAYCLFEVVKFTSVSDCLFFGLKQFLGDYYPVVGVCVQAAIVFLIVRYLYKHQIFIKA